MNNQFLKINPDKTEILLLYIKSMAIEVIIRGMIIDQIFRGSKEYWSMGKQKSGYDVPRKQNGF